MPGIATRMAAPAGPGDARAAARDRVAVAAAALVEDGMALGLGTGDTARRFVEALAIRVRGESLRVTCAATSNATASLAAARGLDVRGLADFAALDVAFDGADQVDPRLDLVKGGGGAQTRERIVAASAAAFIVLADAGKLVPVLGVGFPVALEVVPEAVRLVTRRAGELGAVVALRPAPDGGGAFVTDLGHSILDAAFERIEDAPALSAALDAIPGIVGHGLFVGLASLVLVGDLDSDAVRRLERPDPSPRPGGTP